MTTKLIGANAYNNQKETLGEIDDYATETVERSPAWL